MKKEVKEKKKKKVKKEKKVKKPEYFKQVRSEMKQVVFPNKKEVFKYTIATIVIVLLMIGFFELVSFVLSVIKGAL